MDRAPPPPAAAAVARRAAIVLAGGRSVRMGRDKATLPFGETTLLERVVAAVRPAVGEVVVVARRGQSMPEIRGGGAPVQLVFDLVEGKGPLAGLAPGLQATSAAVAFATSCDVPFLSTEVVRLLFDSIGDAEVAIAEVRGRLQPLCAVYRRSVLPHVEALLAEEGRGPTSLVERVPHVRVGEEALRRVDPGLLSFEDVDAPDDYERALARLSSSGG